MKLKLEGSNMADLVGFISKKADIRSTLISNKAIIYGKSKIDINTIIHIVFKKYFFKIL